MRAATGSGLLFALGLERAFGVPGQSALTGYRAILPAGLTLTAEEGESGQVNQSGFIERGVPGPRGGEGVELGLPLSAELLLEFFEHLLGGVEKTTLAAGPPAVYRYTFEPTLEGVDTSFYGLSSSTVERSWGHGIKFAGLEAEIGDNEEIATRLTGGMVSHGTQLGMAEPEEDNTGTYAKGPYVRGPLRDSSAGDVWIKVTRVLESAGGLQFQVEQSAALPGSFDGAQVSVVLDPISGEAVWQNLQADGLDLGIWDKNKDPFEIIFPGLPSDHEDLAVGDVYRFRAPGTWTAPAVVFQSGFSSFTSAHWVLAVRRVGASAWIEKRVRSGKITFEWPLSAERGNQSRYPYALLRGDEQFAPGLELSRAFVDSFFSDSLAAGERIEARLSFEGKQLGAYRQGITLTYPSLRIDEDQRPFKDSKIVEESVTLTGETNANGDPPVTVEVVTARNWTPTEA